MREKSRFISFSHKQVLEVDGSRYLVSVQSADFRVQTGMPLFKDTS